MSLFKNTISDLTKGLAVRETGLERFFREGIFEQGKKTRDEDPEFFSTDPDPDQLKKNSGSDLKSK